MQQLGRKFNDGNLIQEIGALLLELGRTTLSLHMGQSSVSHLTLWVNHVETEIWNCLCQWHCQIKESESCLHAGIAVCRVRLLSMRGLPFSYHLQDQTPLWSRSAGFNVLCLFMSTPMNILLSLVLWYPLCWISSGKTSILWWTTDVFSVVPHSLGLCRCQVHFELDSPNHALLHRFHHLL